MLLLHSLSLYSVAAAGEVVTLCIGPDRKLYYVHKQLLCHHSGYFRAAYNGSWKEAEDGVTLDFVEPEVFNIFLHCLYAQRLPNSAGSMWKIIAAAGSEKVEPTETGTRVALFIIRACVFGDRFLASGFKRDVHNLFVSLKGRGPAIYKHINYAFDHLREDAALLSYLVDLQCISRDPTMDGSHEIAKESMNLCSYHCHESDKEREACHKKKAHKAKA
jgi:hypothetical protein